MIGQVIIGYQIRPLVSQFGKFDIIISIIMSSDQPLLEKQYNITHTTAAVA